MDLILNIGGYVKIVVQTKTDYYKYDQFLDKVLNSGAYDVKVMENISEMTSEELDEEVNIEDTQEILTHFVASAEIDVDRDKLTKYLKTLYIEATHLGL